MKNRRFGWLAVAIVAGGLVVAACGGSSSSTRSAADDGGEGGASSGDFCDHVRDRSPRARTGPTRVGA